MYASPEARQAAINNARAYVSSLPQIEAVYLTELIEAESAWTPDAASGTGARGLSQFTQGTWGDTVKWIRANPERAELPAGLTPEALEDYGRNVDKPLANAVMARHNMRRLEDQVLKDVNKGRLRAGLDDAPDLLTAVDGDPRRWATVLATGHKDGGSRQRLWFNENTGEFDPERAIAFYEPRAAQARAEAQTLRTQAEAARAAGNEGRADTLFRRARQKSNSDANGHVFGYADRIAGTVGAINGQPPLEFTREQTERMFELRIPGATDQNPNVVGLRRRLDTGAGIVEPSGEDATAQSTDPSNQTGILGRVGTALLDTVIPPAAADASIPVVGGASPEPPPANPTLGEQARDLSGDLRDTVGRLGSGIAGAASEAASNLGGVIAGGIPDLFSGVSDEVQVAGAQGELDRLLVREGGLQNPDVINGIWQGLLGTDVASELQDIAAARIQAQEQIDAAGTPELAAPGTFSTNEPDPFAYLFEGPNGTATPELTPLERELQVQLERQRTLRESAQIDSLNAQAAGLNAQVDERLRQDNITNLALAGLRNAPTIDLGTSDDAIAGITANELGQTGLSSDFTFSRPTFANGSLGEIDLPSGNDFARTFNAVGAIGDPGRRVSAQSGLLNDLAVTDPVEAARLAGLQQIGFNPFLPVDTNTALMDQNIANAARGQSLTSGLGILDQANNLENANLLDDSQMDLVRRRLAQILDAELSTGIQLQQDNFRFAN